jgi:hypothetical protein
VIQYLAAENALETLPQPPSRCAQVQFYFDSIQIFSEANVNKENLVGRHSYTGVIEMQESEIACLKDQRV